MNPWQHPLGQTQEIFAGVLFALFGTVVTPFSKDRHSRALILAGETLGLDPVRCDAAWHADYNNRVRGRSGGIADQLRAIAFAVSCDVGAAKPDRSIYVAAAQALGIEPARLLFVGDGSDDELDGAALAGLTPALVEAKTSDTYDTEREAVVNWAGIRLQDLSGVLRLMSADQRNDINDTPHVTPENSY